MYTCLGSIDELDKCKALEFTGRGIRGQCAFGNDTAVPAEQKSGTVCIFEVSGMFIWTCTSKAAQYILTEFDPL